MENLVFLHFDVNFEICTKFILESSIYFPEFFQIARGFVMGTIHLTHFEA